MYRYSGKWQQLYSNSTWKQGAVNKLSNIQNFGGKCQLGPQQLNNGIYCSAAAEAERDPSTADTQQTSPRPNPSPQEPSSTPSSGSIIQDGSALDEDLKLANYDLCEDTLGALEKRGITTLFPIQKHVFKPALDGRDLIGRAKTGSGKTLAFTLPILEGLLKEDKQALPRYGDTPRAIILEPTRELAKQVEKEIESTAPNMRVGVFYGGITISNQMRQLTRGIDIVVGTPGRLVDLINRGALKLDRCRFAVLDESDSMLDMGFQEDVESILSKCALPRQTMLFSATLPAWIKKLARKYQKSPLVIDLVGEENTGRLAEEITALAMQVHPDVKRKLLLDIIAVYCPAGKAIVFCRTKRESDEVSMHLSRQVLAEPLHGDLSQAQRDSTMQRFREGRTSILVATDVASRGLDIPSVDLIVHYELPQDPEAFLHRSGRTGRAGRAGITIAMITPQDTPEFQKILQQTNTGIEMISPPGPDEIVRAAAAGVYKKLTMVKPEVTRHFTDAAGKMLKAGDPVHVLATALAALSGYSELPQPRSLLSQMEGFITLKMKSLDGSVQSAGQVVGVVSKVAGVPVADQLGRIKLYMDSESDMQVAVFDLPAGVIQDLLSKNDELEQQGLQVIQPKTLPVEVSFQMQPSRGSFQQSGRGKGYNKGYGGGGINRNNGSADKYGRKGGQQGYNFGQERYASGRAAKPFPERMAGRSIPPQELSRK